MRISDWSSDVCSSDLIAQSAYVESEDRRVSSSEAWLKPAEAMEDDFSDLPEAIRNTLVIAQRCAFMAPKRAPILPSLGGDRDGEAAQHEIRSAQVRTSVDHALLVCRHLIDKKTHKQDATRN